MPMGILNNKIIFMECAVIIINYCTINNVVFNYIINALYVYYISNQILREKCDNQENLELMGLLLLPVWK